MPGSSLLGRRRTLVLGFLAVTASLALLLALQYVWLQRLRDMTALAHRAAMDTFVSSVGAEVEFFYRSAAERCLRVPDRLFSDTEVAIAKYWSEVPRDGIRRLFVVDYSGEQFGHFFMYDENSPRLLPVLTTEEGLAIVVAVSPLQMLHVGSRPQQTAELSVTERDLDHRILVQPVLGPDRRVVGAAGMVLDEDWFRNVLLPDVIRRKLQEHFPERASGDVVVMVRDGQGDLVFATGDIPDHRGAGDMEPTHAAFPLVFREWTVSLAAPDVGPERWARAGFAFNMTLSIALAAALLGGIVLTMRAANRAMQLSDLKSEFVSNVSHELRTPLASIRTFSELLRLGRASSPEKVREYGEHIESESRRLSQLVDNILDFSRIESGRKEYRFVEGQLEDVVDSVVESFELRSAGKDFTFERHGPDSPLPLIEMDEAAIGQVVYNLVDNAIKYSGDSRRIRVDVGRDDGSAYCAVRDWGVGIPKKEQKHVFERFHRVGSALVHDVKGSGLGLAIVQHVMRAHGGTVDVDSEPGDGTLITVRLPIQPGRRPGANGAARQE
ncbi:MAG: HAMP domain-containing sensor histidine kinase [bacterium]